jgi:glycosyltransferase involved in cell wall biosynthesis
VEQQSNSSAGIQGAKPMTLRDLPSPPAGKSGWPWTEEPVQSTVRPGNLPRVTIVTPSYNQADFLEETLRSVLLQNYPNLEYIVMDGGSKDGSVDIIRKYEKHLSYWSSEKDGGASDAIARGFQRATGSIMAFINSDDPYRPNAINEVVRVFQRNPKCGVVFGNTYWTDTRGDILAERRQTPFWAASYFYGGTDLQQPSTFWRSELYLKAGGMDPSFTFAFDTDLFFRFIACQAQFHHLRQFLSSYRIHAESKSSTLVERRDQELARIRSVHLRHGFHSPYAQWIRNLGRLHRAFWYVMQGDARWLVSRVPDRIAARRDAEPVGPRSANI